jgi:predicted metalloprotease
MSFTPPPDKRDQPSRSVRRVKLAREAREVGMAEASGAARGPRRAVWGGGAALLGLAALALVWGFGPRGTPPSPPLDGERAHVASRQAEAAFGDAERFWAARFRAELGRAYAPAELRHFSRTTQSPCAGTAVAAGPFYCASTGIVATDLAFLDALGRRLRADAQRATTTFVARAVAGHAQAQLGAGGDAETGDCLVGVWAADAAPRIGVVSPDLYGRMLVSAREVAAETTAAAAGWRDPALFARGARTSRQSGFARGLEAGGIAGCLPAGLAALTETE